MASARCDSAFSVVDSAYFEHLMMPSQIEWAVGKGRVDGCKWPAIMPCFPRRRIVLDYARGLGRDNAPSMRCTARASMNRCVMDKYHHDAFCEDCEDYNVGDAEVEETIFIFS